jgi:hypothetical protein
LTPAAWTSIGRSVPLIIVAILIDLAWLGAQSVTVTRVTDTLHVRAPEFRFLQGRVLTQLRDGRTARLDVRLELLGRANGTVLAQTEQGFNVSFDLWEERFAVTRLGQPSRSVSHLTSTAAEAWCLDNVTIPLTAIPPDRRSAVWMRLVLRTRDEAPARQMDEDSGFSIRILIDALGRRSDGEVPPLILQAGPFNVN